MEISIMEEVELPQAWRRAFSVGMFDIIDKGSSLLKRTKLGVA